MSEELKARVCKLLREIEWEAWGSGERQCPKCAGLKNIYPVTGEGHEPDCELAAVLRELERA